MTTPASPSLTSLSQRLMWIVGELRAKVAARGGRDRAMVPLLTLAWLRLGRLAARFEVLVARLVAGQPVVACRPRVRVRAARAVARPDGVLRLPGERMWLIRLVQETAQLLGHVEGLLADPEMAALLAAAPNAGRILRPLCHMLGIEPGPGLALASAVKSGGGVRPVRRAPRPARVEPPTAISLVWQAIRNAAEAMAVEPVKHKPPWRVDMSR